MENQSGYVVYPDDNVGTALAALSRGRVNLLGDPGDAEVEILEEIPFGHKFALRHIAAGSPIMKYGACIGTSTAEIRKGEHVHLHNVRSNFDERSSELDVVTAIPADAEYRLYWEGSK